MAWKEFDTKAVHLPRKGQSGKFSWAKSDGISTNVCEQILTFIRNQLRNGRGKTGDNMEERYNGRRIIARNTEGKRSSSVYGQTRVPEQPCIENVGNTWRKRSTFPQPGPSSVARLAVYLAVIRHEWECQPRRWYGHYTCSTGWERPTVRDTLHVPRSPPSVSLRHSDLSLETKPERVPDLFVVSFQEEEVQRANTSPLFNGATGSSHELFIAAR